MSSNQLPAKQAQVSSDVFGLLGAAMDYAIDAAQRTVLFWDVMRQRGNQYREHLAETVMTLRTSLVAVCCSRASASLFSNWARGSRLRPPRVLAFVPVERSLRPRVGLFAPLRDKVTSSAQSLVVVARVHSITSSARASTVGGISRPSAFAAFRLMTRSNLVGCSTGRSRGFVPLRILST